MRRGFLAWWAVFTMVGCQDDQPVPSEGRGLAERPSTRREAREPAAKAEPDKKRDERSAPTARPEPFEVRRTTAVTTDAATGGKQKRDFEGRLREMLGTSVGCLEGHLASDPPARIRIRAHVVVTARGVMGRTSVNAPHLDAQGRRCIERELAKQRFEAPVADAPRSVRATVAFERNDT